METMFPSTALGILSLHFPTVFVYFKKSEAEKANMAEWLRFTRGQKGWFDGKDILELGDNRRMTNPMFISRVLYETNTGVLEVYVNMYEGAPYDPVRSQRSIGKALKEYFGAKGMTICDIMPGKLKKGLYPTRVSFYAKLNERPDAEKAEKVRDVIRAAAVEPVFEGTNKSGETVQYAYTELPYGVQYCNRIRKACYDTREGKPVNTRTYKGYTWRVI